MVSMKRLIQWLWVNAESDLTILLHCHYNCWDPISGYINSLNHSNIWQLVQFFLKWLFQGNWYPRCQLNWLHILVNLQTEFSFQCSLLWEHIFLLRQAILLCESFTSNNIVSIFCLLMVSSCRCSLAPKPRMDLQVPLPVRNSMLYFFPVLWVHYPGTFLAQWFNFWLVIHNQSHWCFLQVI